MRAIILAAGVGSRLRPLTDKLPKTLVPVGGKPILAYQIEALLAKGVSDIVVCTGYRAPQIAQDCHLRYPDQRIKTVENTAYGDTNNMYSLYLARKHLEGDVLVMNGDVCFDDDVIAALLAMPGSAVAVERGAYNAESMKVVADEYVRDISKTIPPRDAFGCSIDVYRFVARDTDVLRHAVNHVIEDEEDRNQWTEVALQRLFSEGDILARPCPVSDRWLEVDDYADLNAAEKKFNPRFRELGCKKVFFFDRDGTLTMGDSVMDGAAELLLRLKSRGIPSFVLTNNSSRTRAQHAERMSALPITEDQIVMSTDAAVHHLKSEGIERLFLSATSSVAAAFRDEGFSVQDVDPEAVVLTYNDELDYAHLKKLVQVVQTGIPYLATHTDMLYPYEGGFLPDIGCLIEMVAAATGRRPDMQFGKPARALVGHVLDAVGAAFGESVIVGDRLYTDIALADGSEMTSVLVLSGETDRTALIESPWKPDVILQSVADLIEIFD